MEAQKSV